MANILITNLKNGPLLHLREWNGEDYTVGKVVYTPVYRFQNENIDLDALEENSLEWIKATEVMDLKRGNKPRGAPHTNFNETLA